MKELTIKIFALILRITLIPWLKLAYNLKAYNEKLEGIRGPFILVGNHCLNWDPFMAGAFLKDNTRFIASDNLFRNKLLAFILTNFVGAIPKKKAVSDMKTIRLTLRELKKGNVIGVYPEGNRTWNGRTSDILYSTSKLVKFMKVPVVTCIIKGGYLSRPRWSVKGRKGVLELHYDVLFTVDQIRQMDTDEIYQIMNKAIQHNEYDWQREKMHRFKSKKPAEFLENYLYICPDCKKIGTMYSERDEFRCKNCKLLHIIDEYGFFINKDRIFETPLDWGDWQEKQLPLIYSKKEVIFSDEQAILFRERDKGKKIKEISKGRLILNEKEIHFETENKRMVFYIKKIQGNTIQLNCIFEFYYEGKLVRFRFRPKNRVSAFKWNQAVEYIKKLEDNNE